VPVDVHDLGSGVTSLTAGQYATCALLTDGRVQCWGGNWAGYLGDGSGNHRSVPGDVVGLSIEAIAISGNYNHVCAVIADGGIKCWGYNEDGQLGNGTTTRHLTPVDSDGFASEAISVAAGSRHNCALTNWDGIRCWGENNAGQLGDGTSDNYRYIPVDTIGLASGAAIVTAGSSHSCALTSDGAIRCWGGNQFGQLGDGTTLGRSTPVEVLGLRGAASAVEAGGWHTCTVMVSGGVKCWGMNTRGQLGDGSGADRTMAVDVVNLQGNAVMVAAGAEHTCALMDTHNVRCWGANSRGQLGDGTTVDHAMPVDVVGLNSDVVALTAGGEHTCALMNSGAVACWGSNSFGQLGDGTWTDRYTPVNVVSLEDGVTDVTVGDLHSCALTSEGQVKCWGSNDHGQLGDGTTVNRSTPVNVVDLAVRVLSVSAGYDHTVAVTSAGGIKGWGENVHGELGIDPGWIPVDVIGLGDSGTYHISGRIMDGVGDPIVGAVVSDSEGHTATTDSSGDYFLDDLPSGIHNISSSKSGYGFSPAAFTVTVKPSHDGVDFVGAQQTYAVSGTIRDIAGSGVSGVRVTDGSGHTTTTDPYGRYSLQGILPGTTTLQPSKDGFGFAPYAYTVVVPPARTGVDFVATLTGSGYSIQGRVSLPDGPGIEGATVYVAPTLSVLTDSAGYYTIPRLPAGTYDFRATKVGYAIVPPRKAVILPPNAIAQNFDAFPAVAAALNYIGPFALPAPGYVLDEGDSRITVGDHVHLKLPFRNTGSKTLNDATVSVSGPRPDPSQIPVQLYNGKSWVNYFDAKVSPSTLAPGQTGWIDFWIYVTNPDPSGREALSGVTSLRLETLSAGLRTVPIRVEKTAFQVSGSDALKADSCLHTPYDFNIRAYAQYASGAASAAVPPANNRDPDTAAKAVVNLAERVNEEFLYSDNVWSQRQIDTALLARRHMKVGVCAHYADLTTGLLRSLGLPSRLTYWRAWNQENTEIVAHAWVEALLDAAVWRQVDSTWRTALNEGIYENKGFTVIEAWADRNPLSSAMVLADEEYRCIERCYVSPVDCTDCRRNSVSSPGSDDTSCTEDRLGQYHNVTQIEAATATETDAALTVSIQAPLYTTQGEPFIAEISATNSSGSDLNNVTVSVSEALYADSVSPILSVSPPAVILAALTPGETATISFAVTPLVAGKGIPLRAAALSGASFGFNEQPIVVNEAGTQPDLTIVEGCAIGSIRPGQKIALQAAILDEFLIPITDDSTTVVAIVRSQAEPDFALGAILPYCAACTQYQQDVALPEDAPLGAYEVSFTAGRTGYDSAHVTRTLFVEPTLQVTMTMSAGTLLPRMDLSLSAAVGAQEHSVSEAAVIASVETPSGVATVPLSWSEGSYRAAFRPADLEVDLGGIPLGEWRITVNAEYLGAEAAASGRVTVVDDSLLYLPMIWSGS